MSEQQQEKTTPPVSGLGGAAAKPAPGETAKHVAAPPPPPPAPEGGNEPKAGDELPAGSPAGLKEAAAGELDEGITDRDHAEAGAKEKGALDFMLSNPSPQPFKVDTLVDTPEGLKKLVFHMRQIDASRIEALETEHTNGVGPFATVDRVKLNVSKIAEATVKMVDENGKEMVPTDPEFYGEAIAPPIAFERMFSLQPGVAEQLAEQIDRMAGMTRDRVGMAEREMTTAVGNS